MKICQSCKTDNPDNARYCRRCGRRFNDWKEENKRSASDQKLISNLQHDLSIKKGRVSALQSQKAKIKLCLWIVIILIFALLCTTIYYCYILEQPNYSGDRFISNVIGQRNFLLIDGNPGDIEVALSADGNPIRYTVQTNIDSVHIYGQPDWVKFEYNDSTGEMFVSALPNFSKTRSSNFSIGCDADTIGVRVTQKSRGKKALTVNGYSNISSNVSHLGETIYYDIVSEDGECSVKSKPDWCTVERNKNGILAISYKRNPKSDKRTGKIALTSDEYSAEINVTQKDGEIRPKSGKIESVSIDHNVYEDSKNGMRIYVCFTTQNMLKFEGRVVAYFYYSDGKRLIDKNDHYSASDGQVAVGKNFLPDYNDCRYSDFTIFMPYEELDLSSGSYNLKFSCTIWDFSNGSKVLARSQFYNFRYSK